MWFKLKKTKQRKQAKRIKSIITLVFLITITASMFTHLLPPKEAGWFNPLSTLLPKPVSSAINSEEESIDSFDVHPESLRWNTTLDDSLEDRVIDSQLELLQVDNTTDGSGFSGYEMNRGTVKTDGKIEWRMSSDGGGNQTEYFRDQLGDECDFTEGDEEGFAILSGSAITVVDGIISVTRDVSDSFWGMRIETDPVFSPIVFTGFEVKAKGTGVEQTEFRIQFGTFASGSAIVLEADLQNDWEVFEVDLSASSLWTDKSKIEFFDVIASTTTSGGFDIDYLKITGGYDFATHLDDQIADTWDWEVDNDTEDWTGLEDMNVSDGFLRGTMNSAPFDNFITPAGLSIDTSLFDIFKVRLNTSDVSMDILFRADLGSGIVDISTEVDIDSTSQTVYTIDLSGDSDWTGTCVQFIIHFDEEDGTLDGDEIVYFDYVLLLGEYNPTDTVIGLMDSVGTPLLNISTHFFGNNTNRIEFELLDATGGLSYYWYSDLFGDLDGQFLIGKCSFDVLRSKLDITITNENNTRIDKITFPQEFTEASGLTPALFSNEIAPYVFISTHITDHSWSKVFIDWIKADYKERAWIQSSVPDDKDVIVDSVFVFQAEDSVIDSSSYQLNIPYLDVVSGTFSNNFTNPGNLQNGDSGHIGFNIIGVDANDGDFHTIATVNLGLENAAPFGNFYTIFVQMGTVELINTFKVGNFTPRIDFSFRIYKERTIGELKLRFWEDASDTTDPVFFDIVGNATIPDIVDDPSQEFVVKVFYTAQIVGDSVYTALFEDFGLIERDIFSDIAKAIVEPIGNLFTQVFTGLFKFIAGIFRVVGDVIVLGIATALGLVTIAIGAVTTAVNQIQGWLTTLGTTIGTAINQIQGWLNAIAATIAAAIDQIEGWLNAIAATIAAAVDQIEGWLNTIATAITDALAEVAADIWLAFGIAAADIMDKIVEALTALAEDFAAFLDAVMAFLIPLLLALAEDLAELLMDILDFVIPALLTLLGTVIEGIIEFLTEAFFFLWDALALPDLLAVFGALLVGFIQFIEAIPQFITDVQTFLIAITDLFVVIGFVIIFILPLAMGSDTGEFIDKMINHMFIDVTGGISILGFKIPVPLVLPWGGLLVFTMLDGTIFFGFF